MYRGTKILALCPTVHSVIYLKGVWLVPGLLDVLIYFLSFNIPFIRYKPSESCMFQLNFPLRFFLDENRTRWIVKLCCVSGIVCDARLVIKRVRLVMERARLVMNVLCTWPSVWWY